MKRLFCLIVLFIVSSTGYSQKPIVSFNKKTEIIDLEIYTNEILNDTKAIEANPKDAEAYYDRGLKKEYLEDHRGAIADFTQAMKINPAYTALCSFDRGMAKANLGDHIGAIADYTKFIEINPEDNRHILPYAYGNRGLAKLSLNQKESGCLDLSKAGELGLAEVYEVIKEYCK